jgi:hypothetical protein
VATWLLLTGLAITLYAVCALPARPRGDAAPA